MSILQLVQDFFRPVLSDRTILRLNRRRVLIDGEISSTQIQPNSVDLTLAATWKKPLPNDRIYMKESINPQKEINYEEGEFQIGRAHV